MCHGSLHAIVDKIPNLTVAGRRIYLSITEFLDHVEKILYSGFKEHLIRIVNWK
jgi:hypothetical protein